MYFSSPFLYMMYMLMVGSTMMTLISPNWVTVWIMLEINMLAFMPVICASKRNQETEAAVKYFIVQSFGSMLLLAGSLMSFQPKMYPIMVVVLMMSLLLKLGAFPGHFWYPNMMASLSWGNCLLLSTWQKIAPLALLTTMATNFPSKVLLVFAGINAIVGGYMGMNQTNLRALLAYSSIGHLGWMLTMVALNKLSTWVFYFIVYCITVIPIFMLFSVTNSKTLQDLYSLHKIHFLMPVIVMTMLLSLAGMPPLTGFMPKLLVINTMMHTNLFVLVLLLLGSFMNLYYYLSIAMGSLFAMMSSMKISSSMSVLPWLILSSTAFIGIILLI